MVSCQWPYWFAKTIGDFCIKIEFLNSRRNGLIHQYGRRFFTLLVLFCAAYTLLTRPNQVETAVQSFHFWLLVWTLSSIIFIVRGYWPMLFSIVTSLLFVVFIERSIFSSSRNLLFWPQNSRTWSFIMQLLKTSDRKMVMYNVNNKWN